MRRAVLAGLTLMLAGWSAHGVAETYSFGVVPQQAASKLARLWAPMLQRISAASGTRLRFATARDIPEFERRLVEGRYHFAYMNPYHFTVFNRRPGYRAVARAKDKRIKGIVVVHKDSKFDDLAGLDGAQVAFPAPAAFAASLLTRSGFRAAGVAVTPRYVSSHDSVYRSVARGLHPAGGGVFRTFRNAAPEVRGQLRVLWTTDAHTPHAIAVHPDVPEETVSAVQAALLALDGDEGGRALVAALKLKGFVAAKDADWDDVRALKLSELDELLANR